MLLFVILNALSVVAIGWSTYYSTTYVYEQSCIVIVDLIFVKALFL